MGTPLRRRLGAGIIGLCVLAIAGTAQPVLASAAPSASPSPTASANATEPGSGTSTSYSTVPKGFAVTVSPARLTVDQHALDRTQQMTLVNRGQDPVSLVVQKRNFVVGPDGGLSYQADAPYGAANWLSVSPTRLTLQPGTSQQVTATVEVPASPEPGDHQAALIFLAPTENGPGNVKVNRGIGTPVYLTVPGPVDDSVLLNSLSGPRWSFRGDPTLTASLTSTGTVHRDFRGPTALSVGTPGQLSRFSDFTVTRGADRVVSTTWDAPLFCVCHPSLSVTDAGRATQTMSTTVVVLPWWSTAGLLLVLAAGVLLLLRSRRRNRHPKLVVGADAAPAGESG